jgi:hypothetical protein
MRAHAVVSRGLVAAVLAGLALCAWSASALADGPLPATAQYAYGEEDTARSAGMGGALRALGNGTTAIFVNPADLVLTRVYHLEAIGQITPEAGRQVYGAAIVDSITGRLAGGLSVTGGWVNGADHALDRTQLNARLALAYPLGDVVSLGVAGRYAKLSQAGLHGPFGDSLVSGGLAETPGDRTDRSAMLNTVTFDAGLTVKAGDALHIAVVGKNLSYPNNGLLPTTLGGGIGYGTADLSLEVDAIADFNSYVGTTARIMAGGEYLLGDHFPLRLGYRFDQGAKVHFASAGLGYVSPQFSIEAAVQRSISDPGLTNIVFGLAYFLESSGLTRTPTEQDVPGLTQ